MEIDSSLTVKQARHMLKHLDHVHSQYYHYYTNRNWGHSNNYDLCINLSLIHILFFIFNDPQI